MQIRDKAPISTREVLPNGFLRFDAVLARTGIQVYSAGEVGRDDLPAGKMLNIWRPASEVFKADSLRSFAMVPVTNNHPASGVDTENASSLQVGTTGSSPRREGDLMASEGVLTDAKAIKALDDGKVELSNGYDCDFEWKPGIVPDGERDAGMAYDGRQINIIGNHVALVDAGRCGADCRIMDHAPAKPEASCNCHGDATMADKALTKKMIDGVGLVEATDEAFIVIDSLTKARDALQTKLETAEADAAVAAATAETALNAEKAKVAELEAAKVDDAALDARVAARAGLVSDAKRIGGAGLKTDGLSDSAIRRAAVTAKLGADKVADKADGFFDQVFDGLVLAEPADGQRQEPQRDRSALSDAMRPQNDGAKVDPYEERMKARLNSKKAA